jgi:hypothetical protein
MREDGAREVFSDPDRPKALVAEPAGAAVRTAGGVRVSGRWRFASGITHCDWVVLGCMIMQDGKPNMTPHGGSARLPASERCADPRYVAQRLCGREPTSVAPTYSSRNGSKLFDHGSGRSRSTKCRFSRHAPPIAVVALALRGRRWTS